MQMIECVAMVLFILTLQKQAAIINAAVSIDNRIQVLKSQIMAEIQNDAIRTGGNTTKQPKLNINDYYEYLVTDADDAPIKPIIQYKKIHKHRHREQISKNKHNRTPTKNGTTTKHKTKSTTIQKISRITPSEVFYRKMFQDDEERNKPQKWTHCLDLVTPYLNGAKDKIAVKEVTHKDHTVLRLAQLLSLNTTAYSKEDIVSVLYQISNLQIRLFQWDFIAITTIFNVIIPHPVHSFKFLKAGLKEIFRRWHLDTSNTTTFMKQSRIFRPPCIQVSEFEGSTKSSKFDRYTTPSTKKSDSDCSD